MGTELGQLVGYSVRFDAKYGINTRIKYLTDGMLLRESILNHSLKSYGVLILDEIHERSLHSDVLLGMLKRLLESRPDLKLVTMSATPDTEKLSRFLPDACVVAVPGRLHPVELYYLEKPEPDYVDAACLACIQLHMSLPKGDMLVFMPGQEEIDGAEEILMEKRKLLPAAAMDFEVVPLFSALPQDKQMKVLSQKMQHRIGIQTGGGEHEEDNHMHKHRGDLGHSHGGQVRYRHRNVQGPQISAQAGDRGAAGGSNIQVFSDSEGRSRWPRVSRHVLSAVPGGKLREARGGHLACIPHKFG